MTKPQPAPPTLRVSFTLPGVEHRDGLRGVWFASSLPDAELARLVQAPEPFTAGDEAVRRERDASVVFLSMDDGIVTGATAWKGLMAINEVYYGRLPDGGWFLTDHFRNAIAALPESERRMSDEALLQHYVGAAVYGRATHASGVDRLLNGDRVDIEIGAAAARRRCFSRHIPTATDEPLSRHLDRLDGALEDVIAPLRTAENLAAGFSGGVDSSLLLSYLGGTGTVVTVVPSSPEFATETEYARESARLLRRDIVEIRLDETAYLARLEEHIATVAMPPESYVSPVLASIYEFPAPLFLVGDGADSVFGSGRGIRRVASALSGGLGRGAMRALARAPGMVGRRADQVGEYAALFSESPDSPAGYAGRSLHYHGDLTPTVRMFGEDAITDLSRRMLDEVTERVELETSESDGFFRHIELTQWRYIFADLALVGNHAVQALGKRQVQPYSSWRVISEHLKVPARMRYYRGLTGKWMLKELLTRRVPGYRANKRKLATALPFARYCNDGPLAGFWDRYEVPAEIPGDLHELVRTTPTPMTWKAITHAIWQERVVRNTRLAPHPSVHEEVWPLGVDQVSTRSSRST